MSENHKPSGFTPAFIPTGRRTIDDRVMMTDSKGGLTPIDVIKPQHVLEDELTRKIMGYWVAASEQIARLKEHTFDDIGDFIEILQQEYETVPGGRKGNMTFQSYDALYKIEVRINDYVDYGPELQNAKELVDECLLEWSADAGDELRAIVNSAFHTEQKGRVNRNELVKLTRLSISDPRWNRAMQAIRDAERIVGSKRYVRAYRRETFDGAWEAVTTDMARL